jgi:hypothetical protein
MCWSPIQEPSDSSCMRNRQSQRTKRNRENNSVRVGRFVNVWR